MDLRAYLEQPGDRSPQSGALGVETDWLPFCQIELKSGRLMVGDASFIPSMGHRPLFVTDLPSGVYAVDAKVLDYGDDRRISRFRVLKANLPPPTPGECLGATWVDTAKLGICDLEVYLAAAGEDLRQAIEAYEAAYWNLTRPTVVILDASVGAVMPVVRSGFGDGTYPVFALDEVGGRAGIEVLFIPQDMPYPF